MQTGVFIIVFFTLGYVAKGFIARPTSVVKWLNTAIVYVAMPSIILLKIPTLEFSPVMLIPAGFAWLWALLGGLLVLLISRQLNFSRPIEGAALLLVILGNTSFLGYPLVLAFLGGEALSYAIFYDQLGSFLMLSTAGVLIIAWYAPPISEDNNNASPTIGAVLKRVMSFPPFIALVVASTLPIQEWTFAIEPTLRRLSAPLMPLALFVIGLLFTPQLLPEHRRPLAVVIALKMVTAPTLAYAYLALMNNNTANLPAALQHATLLEAAMPCMITPGIMAIQAGLSPRFCAALLGYSTLFSFAWLPVVAVLAQAVVSF